jgi:hypothetical protein
MEDMRSNPNEESLESPEAREEKETLDQATHEAEAHVERTAGHEQAEVIEGLVKDMVKGAPEAVDPTKPPGTSDAQVEEIAEPEGGDDATPINLPDTQQTGLEGATPLPIPKDEDKAGEIGEIEDSDKSELIDLPDTKKVDISATPLPIPQKGTVSKWEFDPPPEHDLPDNKVALDDLPDNEIALDDLPDNEVALTQEEGITPGTAPTEMPPEAGGLDSDEMVGMKFSKPIPAEEETAKFKGEPAMVKGDAGMEPDPPDPDPDYSGMVKGYVGKEPIPPDPDPDYSGMVKGDAGENLQGPPDPDAALPSEMPPENINLDTNEVVGMKFHPTEKVSGPGSPGVDQVSKIDSFTKEGELHGSAIGEDMPDLEAPPISELSEERGYVKQSDEVSKDPAYLKAQDEVSKDPAYLEASERDITDADSSPPEGDEIEEGD